MPVAEEIRELHRASGPKVIEINVKEIWRTENPTRNPKDFFSTPETNWKLETQARLDDFSNRWTFESSTHQLLNKIDESTQLQFKPNDQIYTSLMDRFG